MSCVAADAEWSDCESSSARSAVTQHTNTHTCACICVHAKTTCSIHPLPKALQLSFTVHVLCSQMQIWFSTFLLLFIFFPFLSEPSLALSPAVSELLPRMKTNKHVNALHFFFPLMICFCLGHSNVKSIIGGWMLKCEGRG